MRQQPVYYQVELKERLVPKRKLVVKRQHARLLRHLLKRPKASAKAGHMKVRVCPVQQKVDEVIQPVRPVPCDCLHKRFPCVINVKKKQAVMPKRKPVVVQVPARVRKRVPKQPVPQKAQNKLPKAKAYLYIPNA